MILEDLSWNRSLLQRVQKVMFVIVMGRFCSVLCVSVFQGLLIMIVMILWLMAVKNVIVFEGGFELQSLSIF